MATKKTTAAADAANATTAAAADKDVSTTAADSVSAVAVSTDAATAAAVDVDANLDAVTSSTTTTTTTSAATTAPTTPAGAVDATSNPGSTTNELNQNETLNSNSCLGLDEEESGAGSYPPTNMPADDTSLWPSMQDLNTRLRRVITAYQRNYKKEELKQQQKAKVRELKYKLNFSELVHTKIPTISM